MKNLKLNIFVCAFFLNSCAWNTSLLIPQSESNQRNPNSFQSCFQLMTEFFNTDSYNGFAVGKLETAKSLTEFEKALGVESLLDIQHRFTDAQIKKSNLNLFSLLDQETTLKESPKYTRFLTEEEAEIVLKQILESRVHKNHHCYDPKNTIGFCFGRATIGHMEAIVRGVHPDSVKKIWIAGDMGEWGHHVADIIKAEDGWWAIDTNLGRVVKIEEWVKTYTPMKAKNAKEIQVFVTKAERFGPYDTSPYTSANLFNSSTNHFDKKNDFYNGYFHDYFEDLEKSMPKIKKFPPR